DDTDIAGGAQPDGFLADLRPGLDREEGGRASQLGGVRDAGPGDGLGINRLDLDEVRGHRVADGDVVLRDEDVDRALLDGRGPFRAQQDDYPDKGEDGEQNADEDDQAIRSLHDISLRARMMTI